ncbi:MAG TPA: phosphoglucosamine mutase [Rudaea sp.]|nr:phosphoglucosamine mutase [Rudaea sp.]
MQKRYFGTDGIRGRAGEPPITAEFMLRLGRAAGKVFAGDDHATVLIGKDTRISGYMLESALEAGLASVGADVLLLGPMPTPAVAWLARTLGGSAGIVISASHNPFWDNGIKFFSRQGEKLDDAVELAIEQALEEAPTNVAPARIGRAQRVDDAALRYAQSCIDAVPGLDLSGMHVVLDCAHGATYQIAPKIFADLGARVQSIGVQPDGLNINRDCGATHPAALQAAVLQHGADIGIAFDGDGDRVQMVDHTGALADGDDLLFILTADRHAHGLLRGPVVGTLMTNFGVESAITALGATFLRANVGDRHVLQALREHDGVLGGEASGHLLCLDHASTGDGILSALLVLDVLRRNSTSLAQARSGLRRLPQITLNLPLSGGALLLARQPVVAAREDVERTLRGRGRVVLRASGTEPLVRVTVEGEDGDEVRQLARSLAAVVESTALS